MSGARRLTIYEPFRSIFYAPQFVALYGGHFAGEGLEVAVRTAGGGTTTTGALIDGHAEIALGGIMRSLDVADRGGPWLPHFAQVNQRNGFFLLSRAPRPMFRWADVVGTTIVSFAEAPTPWQCMLTVLRRHGVDPAAVRIERSRPVPEALAAFRGGHGDFFEQTQPIVEQMLASGEAHLVASMGEATGPVPFTSYMTTPEFLRREPETVLRFTRAVYHTQRWLARQDAQTIAETIAPDFHDIDRGLLERAIERFKKQDTWAHDPVLRRPGYDYLQEILQTGGFIRKTHRYEDLVDT